MSLPEILAIMQLVAMVFGGITSLILLGIWLGKIQSAITDQGKRLERLEQLTTQRRRQQPDQIPL